MEDNAIVCHSAVMANYFTELECKWEEMHNVAAYGQAEESGTLKFGGG